MGSPCLSLPMIENFFSAIDAHGFFSHQLTSQALYLITLSSGGDRHLAGVLGHMATLDALGGQGAESSQVLRQANRDDNLCQLASAGHSHEFK